MHPTTRRRLTYALAAVWLALGYANLVRGIPHAGGDAYRGWAFAHHAYSDVIGLGGDRYLSGARPVPYLTDRVEYPPLLGLALWLPAFAPGGLLGHFTVSYLFLAACLFATLAALERIPGADPLWLGATPAVLYYAGLNWDLLPIALLAFAALALARGRPAAAGALDALGVSAKLFPAVLAPPVLGVLAAKRDRRSLFAFAAALGVVWLLVNVPVWAVAPEGWTWFWRFNAGRGAENSAWHALAIPKGPLLELLSAGPLAATALFSAWGAFAAARRGADVGRAARLGAGLALVVWIATNKIWSPQYALYGFLAAALAPPPGWMFWALSAISVLDFHAAFEVRARGWPPVFTDRVFHPEALVRTALWLVLAALLARALAREARGRRRDGLSRA